MSYLVCKEGQICFCSFFVGLLNDTNVLKYIDITLLSVVHAYSFLVFYHGLFISICLFIYLFFFFKFF